MFARYARPGWSAWGNEADEEVTPKGQVHRGYGGGELETVPFMEPNERMSSWLDARVGRILADEYKSGASINKLAADTGYSVSRVRGLLEREGVSFRSQGRPKKAAAEVTEKVA
jgi:hypothetical protein